MFYNGEQDQPEEYDMKLSDAFEKRTQNPELELVCKVYNINFGKNKQLLEKCNVLREYMIFVDYVRYYHKEQEYDDLATAINRAIDRCIEEDVLADFLRENRSEVVKVTQLDYTFDRQIMLEREDAREEGRQEGRQEGQQEGSTKKAKKIAQKMLKANKPLEEIMEFTELSMDELVKLAEETVGTADESI